MSGNDRKTGVYVSIRDRRTQAALGHRTLRHLRVDRVLELLDEAEEREQLRHLQASHAKPALESVN